MNSSYITSAQQAEQLPHLGGLPEVAFIGRSNCGKSSLLNALLQRAKLARESKLPGRTQMVNFFEVNVGEERLLLADLPGYGYSAIGKEVRHYWQTLVEAYLTRSTLKQLLFLVDVRRAPELEADDISLLSFVAKLSKALSVIVVLTKTDKCNQRDIAAAQASVTTKLKSLGIKVEGIVPVSVLKKKGIEGLRERVLRHMEVGPTAKKPEAED